MFWGYVGCVVVTLSVVFLYEPTLKAGTPSDQHIRFVGMALQLIGAGTVWYDLTHTATGFGAEPSLKRTLAYIKSVFFKPPPVHGAAAVTLMGASLFSTGRVTARLATHTVQERLDQLERSTRKLEDGLEKVQLDLAVQKSELLTELQRSAAEVRREISALEDQLKNALIGNFPALNFGVLWLMVGIILTSFPVETAEFAVSVGLYELLP